MTEKKQAVALHYDGHSAPIVTAKGEGGIAEQIIKTAKEHGIPLHHDKELTALLAKVELKKEIPPELYRAVAQILIFLYFLDGKIPDEEDADGS
ncbi:EscU/YscU/HrcU family type III secretion system export apparatus switch protein [Legionella jordanis]|uniref:Flagellar biosynthetic protein FlhB n=1 Tax=Legionella jordanis TaxID=456 RepID=A0A0W0VDR5_9GAMM|nr:EscU/YscU/HrcU family type III secretion system export apparatus switch protein [Legionella jordanis]KTD18232.1 flagellar protein FlhB [Legionella jordanis]RMX01189.1 flagellar biosynthesis protein FlhB [Legionella jordanis]RMX21419.1 flagellar biosynthesis protein FlhB [Legionella jordanis]VEH13675.1 flagellar biosynthesis protein [Legionella jordanis]HAT8714614.1 flagellar biosynthesis protein FlhB [Legionella jordanis]